MFLSSLVLDKSGKPHRNCTACNKTLDAPFWHCIDRACGGATSNFYVLINDELKMSRSLLGKMRLCVDCKTSKDEQHSAVFDLKFANIPPSDSKSPVESAQSSGDKGLVPAVRGPVPAAQSSDDKAEVPVDQVAQQSSSKVKDETLEQDAKAQVEASPDHHQIAHTLVLYRGTKSGSLTPVPDNPTDVKLVVLQEQVGALQEQVGSLQEQVGSLHEHLGSLETRMEERLGRLEQILGRVAAALGTPVTEEGGKE